MGLEADQSTVHHQDVDQVLTVVGRDSPSNLQEDDHRHQAEQDGAPGKVGAEEAQQADQEQSPLRGRLHHNEQ